MLTNPSYRASTAANVKRNSALGFSPTGPMLQGPAGGPVGAAAPPSYPSTPGVGGSMLQGPAGGPVGQPLQGDPPGGAPAAGGGPTPPIASFGAPVPPNPNQLQMLHDIAAKQGPDAAHAAVAAAAPTLAPAVAAAAGNALRGGPAPTPDSPPNVAQTDIGRMPINPGGYGPGNALPGDISGKGTTYPQDAYGHGVGTLPRTGGAPTAPPAKAPSQFEKDAAATGQWRGGKRFAKPTGVMKTQTGIVNGGGGGPQSIVADQGVNQDPNANRAALIAQLKAQRASGGGVMRPQNLNY